MARSKERAGVGYDSVSVVKASNMAVVSRSMIGSTRRLERDRLMQGSTTAEIRMWGPRMSVDARAAIGALNRELRSPAGIALLLSSPISKEFFMPRRGPRFNKNIPP